jgi:hypothetical protein
MINVGNEPKQIVYKKSETSLYFKKFPIYLNEALPSYQSSISCGDLVLQVVSLYFTFLWKKSHFNDLSFLNLSRVDFSMSSPMLLLSCPCISLSNAYIVSSVLYFAGSPNRLFFYSTQKNSYLLFWRIDYIEESKRCYSVLKG